jgi:hypothetical protein
MQFLQVRAEFSSARNEDVDRLFLGASLRKRALQDLPALNCASIDMSSDEVEMRAYRCE